MQDQVSNSSRTLRGGYGFLTDYSSHPEAQARSRVATLAQNFGIKEFQFYDWFATYSKPVVRESAGDPTNGPLGPIPSRASTRSTLRRCRPISKRFIATAGAPGPTFRPSAPRRRISLTRVPGSTSCATATESTADTHRSYPDFRHISLTRHGPTEMSGYLAASGEGARLRRNSLGHTRSG
jgi:hypothetical protein